MRDLKDILLEASILDIDDTLSVTGDDIRKEAIKKFLKKYYEITGLAYKLSDKPNKDDKFEVSAKNMVRIRPGKRKLLTRLTNGDFIWTDVGGKFDISYMDNLETLEGAPKNVGGSLYLQECPKLKSLDGFPESVGKKERGSMIYINRTGTPKFITADDVKKVCKHPAEEIYVSDYGSLG